MILPIPINPEKNKRQSQPHQTKRYIAKQQKWIAVFLLAAVCLVAGMMLFRNGPMLEINGETVSEQEYIHGINESLFEVTLYFRETYGAATQEEGFWEKEYGGEIPCRKLMEVAKEKIIYRRTVYGLSKERGYVQDTDYASLVCRWEEENQIRAEKIKNGEPVYGLTDFPLELYINYEMDMLRYRFLDDTGNPEMKITQEEREAYFRTGQWTAPDGVSKASLKEVQSVVDRELRKERYQNLIQERISKSNVREKEAELYALTKRTISSQTVEK